MKKNVIYSLAAACSLLLLTACGSDKPSSTAAADGFLGEELNKEILAAYDLGEEFYTYMSASVASTSDEEEKLGYDANKAQKMKDQLDAAVQRLMELREQAVGKELPVEFADGTPLKVASPLAVKRMDVTQGSAEVRVVLEGTVELTADVALPTETPVAYAIGESDSIVGTPRIKLQLTEGIMQPAQSQVKVEIRLEDSRDAMNNKHEPVHYYPIISATKRLRIAWAAVSDDADVDNYD